MNATDEPLQMLQYFQDFQYSFNRGGPEMTN